MESQLDPNSFHHYNAKVNGVNIHYVMEGTGNNAIVLCHGWPDLWYGWRKQIKPLANAGYRVIVPDLRGFGGTDAPQNSDDYNMKTLSTDLACLLDYLKLSKAIFLGHDWGGELVWKMTLYYPDKVRAVGSVCTPYILRQPEFIPLEQLIERMPNFAYQGYLSGPKAAKELNGNVNRFFRVMFRTSEPDDFPGGFPLQDNESFLADLDPPRSRLLSEQELNYYVQQYTKRGFEGGLNYYKTRKINWDVSANLPSIIHHQALMITAGRDPVLRPKMASKMGESIPNLRMEHIEEANHWILVEKPKEVNEILLSWLSSLEQKSKL